MAGSRNFDAWAADVARELVKLGVPLLDAKHIPYEDEEWFRREFEGGEGAGITALEWFNNN